MSQMTDDDLFGQPKKVSRTAKPALKKIEELKNRIGELQNVLNDKSFKTNPALAEQYTEAVSMLRKISPQISTSPASGAKRLLNEVKALIEDDLPSVVKGIPPRSSSKKELIRQYAELASLVERNAFVLDQVRRPDVVFDPSDPNLVGRMIALTFTAQPSVPLREIKRDRFYGSGIYAIYYKGDFAPYAPLKGRPHPIYVGKADPEVDTARTPVEQGEKLYTRLRDHLDSITEAEVSVENTLKVDDFEVRYLVVAGNWQRAAEIFLIRLMNPIWNLEAKILFGFGKHGDDAETRSNKRSPWDTLHPGRKFAENTKENKFEREEILENIEKHFKDTKNRIFSDPMEIFDEFLSEMSQLSKVLKDDLATAQSEDDKAEREGHPGEPAGSGTDNAVGVEKTDGAADLFRGPVEDQSVPSQE